MLPFLLVQHMDAKPGSISPPPPPSINMNGVKRPPHSMPALKEGPSAAAEAEEDLETARNRLKNENKEAFFEILDTVAKIVLWRRGLQALENNAVM